VSPDLAQLADSRVVDLDGQVHYLDFGGPPDGQLIVCVHGLGGACWNWAAVAPQLTEHCRVIAVDLAGHGRSPATGRATTVIANRRLLHRFLTEVIREPVILVGNSMGGLISIMEAARNKEQVTGLVLVDPALPRSPLSPIDMVVARNFALMSIPYAGELAIARNYKLPPRTIIRQTLTLCCVDPERVPSDVIDIAEEFAKERAKRPTAVKEFLQASRSLVRLLARPKRIRADMSRITAPVLLLHGAKDRLVPLQTARAAVKANPSWHLKIADDCGHVPQLEMPDWTAERITDWLRLVVIR
jgi:pimeloyl-ACP methyl ester carboxylesterase